VTASESSESPFVTVATRLGERVDALERRAQALFYCCAARALFSQADGLAEEALHEAQAFALTGVDGERLGNLRRRIEKSGWGGPEQPTTIRSAWTCCDIALRVAMEAFPARDGIWYVLEPQFHATSERLFGVIDVGSERERRDEAIALRDDALTHALAGVEAMIDHLARADDLSEGDARLGIEHLRWLRP
jgi:hypothetical protein